MPGPIGQDYEDAATVGGSGSLNAKMRLMTSQLANLTITTVAASGGTVVSQTAGPWAVSGTVTVNPHAVSQTAGPWAVSGNVQVSLGPSLISTVNSTTSPLSGSGLFTGAFEDVSGYATLAISVFTDQPASGVLSSQFSSDGVNADFAGTHSMTTSGLVLAFTPRARYFRLLYTNGPVAQGILRLQAIYHPLLTLPVTTQPMVATGDPNPTTYRIGANNQVRNPLDGTWQAMAADASGRIVVVQGLGPWAVSGTVTAMGAKTPNSAVPDGTNLGTLPAVATAASPGYIAGNQVALSTDLSGNLRVTGNLGQTAGPWAVSGSVSLTPTVLAADALANPTLAQVSTFSQIYNGLTWDRIRSANAASGTTGTGLAGAGNMLYDSLATGWFNWRGSAVGGGFVQGPAASGTLFVGNPVVMGGLFTSGSVGQLAMPLATDQLGRLLIQGPVPDGTAVTGVNGVNPVPIGLVNSVGGAIQYALGCNGDGQNASRTMPSALMVFNGGTTLDRVRSANAASGTTGTGLLGTGGMLYDPLVTGWFNWRGSAVGGGFVQGPATSGALFVGNPVVLGGLFTSGSVGQLAMPLVTDAAGRLAIIGSPDGQLAVNPVVIGGVAVGGVSPRVLLTQADNTDSMANGNNCLLTQGHTYAFNGALWERNRTANGASGTTGTGLLGTGNLLYDGTNWFPQRAESSANPNLRVRLYSGATAVDTSSQSADGLGTGFNALTSLGFPLAFNGASWDRTRTANAASGTTGTGLLGAGGMVYDPLVTGWYSWRGSAAGGGFVQGPAVSGGAVAGNPLRLGLTDATVIYDWQSITKQDLTGDGNGAGAVGIMLRSQNSGTRFTALQDARACTDNSSDDGSLPASQRLYNTSTWDRCRNNVITNQFNGSNATSGITSHATQVNYNNSGVIATLNITAVSGTAPTLDVKIQIADGAGTFFDLTDSAGNIVAFKQANAVSTDTLKLSPGLIERLGAVANRQYAGQLGRSYRFVSTVGGNLMSFTYRLDVSELK